ncbi:glycosyltransferase family 2 protein [Vibrio cyclitrophicus]
MLRKNKLLSVVTPVYNGQDYIEKTIISVIDSGVDIEYIVIDGASTDSTIKIVERYSNKISTVISESDDGIYNAMNKGLSHCTSEWIGIINADDYYTEHLSELYDFLSKTSSEVDVVYANCLYVDKDEVELHTHKPRTELGASDVLPHPSVFIRKSAYERYGTYDESFRIYSDIDLLRVKFAKAIFLKFDKTVAVMRSGGASQSATSKYSDEYVLIMKKIGINPITLFFRVTIKAWISQFLIRTIGEKRLSHIKRRIYSCYD